MRRIAAGLIHHPVLDRGQQIVTTAITNLDLHDIARSSYSFGVSDFFVAHPVAVQRELALRVQTHWVEGSGGRRIPDRIAPLSRLRVVTDLQEAIAALGGREQVELWTTSAKGEGRLLSYSDARERVEGDGPAVLILFGTGWGLDGSVHQLADYQLEPIVSSRPDGYNHLSVRAAAAITFDRLLGQR